MNDDFEPLAQQPAAPAEDDFEPLEPAAPAGGPAVPEAAPVAPQAAAPQAPVAPVATPDFVRSTSGVTQKAYGVNWEEKPSWWHVMLGPIGMGLHEAAKIKRGWVDPFVENEVQPRLNRALETPFKMPTDPTGKPATSIAEDLKTAGSFLGTAASPATGQTPQQGSQGGEALAEYMTKSSLAGYIGGGAFQQLDDKTKLRAINELEDLNKHPVLAHWLRKSMAPTIVKLADQMVTDNADIAAAAQESLMKEAALLPLYLIGPSKLAVLEGEGIGLALARGSASGIKQAVPGSLATTTEGDAQGNRKEVPQSLDTAVAFGAAVGGAVEGGVKVASELAGAGKGLSKAITAGGEQGVADFGREGSFNPGPEPREKLPFFEDAPVVIGLSSDALESMAQATHAAAAEGQAALAGQADALIGAQGTRKYKEVERTSTKFKPNMVTLNLEGDLPVVRAVQVDAQGVHSGMTIPLNNPQAIAEVQGLSKRWGMSPIVLQDALLSGHANVAPFLPGHKPAVKPVSVGTAAQSPRAQLRQEVARKLGDVALPPDVAPQPGFMIMTESAGGAPGAWQLHQLNDPMQRAESLLERNLTAVTMPDGTERYGFIRHVDAKGNATVLAPAHEEGIAGSLMFDVEVPLSRTKELKRDAIDALAQVEPEALKAERELYRRAKPVASVDELLQTFEKFANRDPETLDLINRYTKRQTEKVIKAPEHGLGAELRDQVVSSDIAAKDRVRQMLATQGLNSSLVDHLVHVANKRRAGLKPTELEMRLLTEEWQRAEKAVRSGQLGTVDVTVLPDPSLEGAAPDSDIPGQSLVPDDKVILASGETGQMVALTEDTAVVRVNDTLRSVHPDEVVAQASPEAGIDPAAGAPAPGIAPPKPPAPPPPPVTGAPASVPPPNNIPANTVLQREFMSNWNKAKNFVMPAYSRGPQDLAQWALVTSSTKALENTVRSDVYNRLHKTFGQRTPEFQEALQHYINGRTDLPAQDQLLNKFPEASLEALAYIDRLTLQDQINEQKLRALGMISTQAADRLDPVHLTNSYLRWMQGAGEWAKTAVKDQALEQRVIRRIIKEGDFAPQLTAQERAQMTPDDVAAKAREFYNELIGLNDKSHAATKASMGSSTKSLLERNVELPPEYQEAMGIIKDPVANIAVTIARQEALIAQGTVYRDVSKSKWASAGDVPQPDVPGWGSWHLVQGQQYGLLNGMYVHPQVWEGIATAHELPARVHTFANAMLDVIKRNRTIYNPTAWGTNVMGNFQGAILAGGLDPILSPIATGTAFAQALRLVAGDGARGDVTSTAGQLLNRARALGMYTPGLAGTEMGMLRDFQKSVTGMQARMGPSFSIMDAMRKLAEVGKDSVSGFNAKVGAVYDGVDQTFKMASWLALRKRGLTNPAKFLGGQFDSSLPLPRITELVEREAARRVATSFPMPHAPSQAAAKLRQVGSGAVGAMNPFMTMQLEEMRIHANIAARLKGQGGESGAEFTGRMIKFGLYGAALTSAMAGIRRANGITDAEVALSKASMTQSAQQYKPGLVPVFWRDSQGNPRFVDLTSGISALRLTQGNSEEENLANRVFYNALKTPVAGTAAEQWLDQTMRLGGFDAAPEGFASTPSPAQLRGWQGMADAAAQAGLLPSALSTVPKAMNQAGLYGTPPKDQFQKLEPAEGFAKALGVNIVPGGNPGYGPGGKARELQFKQRDAAKAKAKSYSLPPGEQPGVRSLGMQNDKEDVQRNATADQQRADKNMQRHRDLMEKAKK